MPHKHNDIKHGVDPELIRRYLAGELDDKAMHILERQALEDPFLAEALDGFESYPADQAANLADLELRLEKRVAEKPKRTIPMYIRWSAAAAVLLLAGLGVMKLWQTPVKQEVARVEEKHDTVTPSAVTDESGQSLAARADKPPVELEDARVKKKVIDAPEAPAVENTEVQAPAPLAKVFDQVAPAASAPAIQLPAPVAKEPAINAEDNRKALVFSRAKPLADTMGGLDYALFPKSSPVKDANADIMTDTFISADMGSRNAQADYSPQSKLQGRVPGIYITEANRNTKPVNIRLLKGNVVAENTSYAVPGAAVSVVGTKLGAITDKNGFFAIPVADSTPNLRLSVAAIGYNSKVLAVGNKQNNLSIAIPEDNKSLNEVVVTGYGASKKKKEVYRAPEPGEGFDSYKEYLEKHVRYPASAGIIKGSVQIVFSVNGDGKLTDFRVVRKLQKDCDTEAIRVVKEGPAWIPASDGRSARVLVDVPFNP